MSDWAALRNQARKLENEVEQKLVAFSVLGNSTTPTKTKASLDTEHSRFEAMALELQQSLTKLEGINLEMHEVIGDNAAASQTHTLSRHTRILDDMRREFARAKKSMKDTRDKAELLTSVQRDINTYRHAEAQRQDAYLRESVHTANATRGAEDAMSIAIAAKEALVAQRGVMGSVNSRMEKLAKTFPALNNVMEKVKYRKNRDKLILAVVVALCICFSMVYTFG
eukprot:m.88221 g.88221  ORF g.88221 m.88221 type:complete len:225 (+) comp26167_c0_seq1:326-1000(+)